MRQVTDLKGAHHGITVQLAGIQSGQFRAEQAMEHIVLGEARQIYVPVHPSGNTCVAEDTKYEHFMNSALHVTIAVLCVIIMCCLCRRAKLAPPTAMEVQLTATGEHAVTVVSVNAVEYSPVLQEDTDLV